MQRPIDHVGTWQPCTQGLLMVGERGEARKPCSLFPWSCSAACMPPIFQGTKSFTPNRTQHEPLCVLCALHAARHSVHHVNLCRSLMYTFLNAFNLGESLTWKMFANHWIQKKDFEDLLRIGSCAVFTGFKKMADNYTSSQCGTGYRAGSFLYICYFSIIKA